MSVNMMAASLRCSVFSDGTSALNQIVPGRKQQTGQITDDSIGKTELASRRDVSKQRAAKISALPHLPVPLALSHGDQNPPRRHFRCARFSLAHPESTKVSCTFPALIRKSLIINGASEGNRTLVLITNLETPRISLICTKRSG